MQQLIFNFPFNEKYPSDEFLLAPENEAAFNFINNYKANPASPKIFAIIGEKYCGKTHLAHIWQEQNTALFLDNKNLSDLKIENEKFYILENVELIKDQTALFHIYNQINGKNSHLLITSSIPLNLIEYQFLDIASRFKNIFSLTIKNPDLELIKMLLTKNFANHQLSVAEPVIDYIAKNIERSYFAIAQITTKLKNNCFEQKKAITIPAVREILGI